jgi:hypothetical protein
MASSPRSAKAKLGFREAMSYAIPGGSGMRRKRVAVSVRCGESSLVEEHTKPDSVGGNDPVWKGKTGKMQLLRHNRDEQVMVVCVWQVNDSGKGQRRWLGGNHIDYTPALNAPKETIELSLPLFVSGTPQGGAGSGVLELTYKWVPADAPLNLEEVEETARDVAAQGELVVTVLNATGLVVPDKIIRDLTTFVDTGPVKAATILMVVYLLSGLAFYAGFMPRAMSDGDTSAQFERFPGLAERLTGGHGQWDVLNSGVFMITSFTTVGFGNHPSLVATLPPCEVPGPQLLIDNPFSTLLPEDKRDRVVSSGQRDVVQAGGFSPLAASCFETSGLYAPGCMVVADDRYVFDFESLLLWPRGSEDPPRNFTGRPAELASLRVPGGLGLYGEAPEPTYRHFADICGQQLSLWRTVEQYKDMCKVFTSAFILFGIGLLGAVVGAVGETLMEWSRGMLGGVAATVDTVSDAATPITKGLGGAVAAVGGAVSGVVDIEAATKGAKGATVALLWLALIVAVGAVIFSATESMKLLDATYFTIVTATTVGFGDYCPQTYYGKLFTLVYVPFSVVAVAGAIKYVAHVPLEIRRHRMEDYVLAQFGDNPSAGDFDDVRHSARLRGSSSIRANDFIVAMALRLGYIETSQVQKIKRIFAAMDKNSSGELTVEDIAKIAAASATGLDEFENPHRGTSEVQDEGTVSET